MFNQTLGCNSFMGHEINFVDHNKHLFPRIGKKIIIHRVWNLFYEMCVLYMYINLVICIYIWGHVFFTILGNKPWIFIGRTNPEAEAPVLWPHDAKSQSLLIGKDPDAGKYWRPEEKRMTEDEMVGWHHSLNGHEFKQTLGNRERQWSLACCSPWDHKE